MKISHLQLGISALKTVDIQANNPIGSMGLVYLPIHGWLIDMVNVGKYTSPMDPMGMKLR